MWRRPVPIAEERSRPARKSGPVAYRPRSPSARLAARTLAPSTPRHQIDASHEGSKLKSVRAVAVGLFAEIVAIFAFYGIAQHPPSPGRRLAIVFLSTLALIGAISTYVTRRHATPGVGKGVAMLVSGAIFAAFVLLLWASLVSLQDG